MDLALEIARDLARLGVPIFVGALTPDGRPDTRDQRWSGWQHTRADPAAVDEWRPGLALCAVMGVVFDSLDHDSYKDEYDPAALDGIAPTIYAETRSPSSGRHEWIMTLGVGSHDGFRPGYDLKGGRADGKGRGFVYLPPTERPSKVTGEMRSYEWVTPPPRARTGAMALDGPCLELSRLVESAPDGNRRTHSTSYTDPAIDGLLEHGVTTLPQYPVLRDMVWKLRVRGMGPVAARMIWDQVTSKTPLTRPDERWTGDHFNAMWNSAVNKLRDTEKPEDLAALLPRSETPIFDQVFAEYTTGEDLARAKFGLLIQKPKNLEAAEREETVYLQRKIRAEMERPPVKLVPLSVKDLLDLAPLSWAVPGVLPTSALISVFGPSQQHKTFLVLDLVLSAAAGLRWLGTYEINTTGPAALFLGEGGAGIRNRFEAWLHDRGGVMPDVSTFADTGLSLMSRRDVDQVIEALRALRDAWSFVVFDAQADFMNGGKEDSADDTSVLVQACRRIMREANVGAVIVISHTGWDETRERGSSRKRQAFDTVIQVQNGIARCVKQRDDELFNPIFFHPVAVGPSLVLREGVDLAAQARLVEQRTQIVMDVVTEKPGELTQNKAAAEAARRSAGQHGFSERGFKDWIRGMVERGELRSGQINGRGYERLFPPVDDASEGA